MQDASISATSAIAYAVWAVSSMLLVLDFFVATHLGAACIFVATIACTIHVRSFIAAQERRERLAFELGRDSAQSVRHLH